MHLQGGDKEVHLQGGDKEVHQQGGDHQVNQILQLHNNMTLKTSAKGVGGRGVGRGPQRGKVDNIIMLSCYLPLIFHLGKGKGEGRGKAGSSRGNGAKGL